MDFDNKNNYLVLLLKPFRYFYSRKIQHEVAFNCLWQLINFNNRQLHKLIVTGNKKNFSKTLKNPFLLN